MCFRIVSRRICSMILPGTEMRLTGLSFPRSYFLPLFIMGIMFSLFQSLGTSPDCWKVEDISKKYFGLKFKVI